MCYSIESESQITTSNGNVFEGDLVRKVNRLRQIVALPRAARRTIRGEATGCRWVSPSHGLITTAATLQPETVLSHNVFQPKRSTGR